MSTLTSETRTKKRDKHRFVKLTSDGTSCICRPNEVADMIDDPEYGFTQADVWMTEAEYEELPEFQGW